jgi:large conductance mechanosensitive channel|tara:strand:- start:5365 stop:5670 length:306 start_codon:yes stop_codon:yes gene_type:complete
MKLAKEFVEFLKEYKIIALAIAFVMGIAAKDLVNSLVNDIIMPFINPLFPSGDWKQAKWVIGSIELGTGPFLSALISFLIIALVVFLVAKKILKEEKVKKK